MDQYDDHSKFEICLNETNSLTGEALNKKRPLFLNEAQINKRAEQGRIVGTPSKAWFGVPLIRGGKVLGIIAAHSYDTTDYLSQKDRNILISVSNQIALAIERKQSLDERNLLKNYLSNIINSMPSILVGVDKMIEIIQWNLQAELETGTTADQAIGKKLVDVFPRLSPNIHQIKESLKSKKMKTILKQESFTGKEIRYADILVYLRLITKNLPANIKAAQEIGISLDDLVTYMAKRDIFKMIDSVLSEGKRAAAIVSNMLSFSRKSSSGFIPEDVCLLLDHALELAASDYNLKKKFDFKNIQIQKEYAQDLPQILCKASELQQAFLNVLKNGAHAMFDIKKDTYSPQFILRSYREETMVCIEIENNGPKIDEEGKKRLFEPFFTTKPVGEGTGLGLSASYFIVVTDHKGELTVESSLDSNTKFIIKLPL